tara:strand:- start:3159 stop:3440 length:282 start_codon:yes stop_codon:yes gene_type:complete
MAEHNAYKKYMESDHKTRGAAIKAMCAHCVGCNLDHMEVGFRTVVKHCTATACPLHNFRPWQDSKDEDILASEGDDDEIEDIEQELTTDTQSV